MKNIAKTMKTLMKFNEKHCKNNEKIMKRFGSRTSTLARGLRPVQVVFPLTRALRALAERLARGLRPIHPGYYNGETQRGNTKGTQWEKKWKNEKWKKQIISINFNILILFKCFKTMYVYKSNEKKNENFRFVLEICFFHFFDLI